jgi:hypothetical protein
LDGRLAFWGTILALGLFYAGKPDEAADEARRACRRDDKLPMPRIVLAIVLTSQGLRDAAEDAMADARRIYPKLKADWQIKYKNPIGQTVNQGLSFINDDTFETIALKITPPVMLFIYKLLPSSFYLSCRLDV